MYKRVVELRLCDPGEARSDMGPHESHWKLFRLESIWEGLRCLYAEIRREGILGEVNRKVTHTGSLPSEEDRLRFVGGNGPL